MNTDSSFLTPDARPDANGRGGRPAARLLDRLLPVGAAAQAGIRRPRTLEHRRRVLRLRRIAIALCSAGLVLGIGLLLLPEPRSGVIVPASDIAQGGRLDRAGLRVRQIPESLTDGFLTDRTAARGCIARIRLPRDRPIPAAACSRVPALRPGQTLISIPTSLTPGALDPGSRASARVAGSAPVPVVLWGFETGSDGVVRARVAVAASRAGRLLDAASSGTVLLSPTA